MRLRRRPELRLVALAAIVAAAVLTIRSSHPPPESPLPAIATTWRGLVGDNHPAVSLGRHMIVVLRTPSVAQRVASRGAATEQQERGWAAQALAAQQEVLTQLARHGLPVRPDFSFARVLDGFSASLSPEAVALLRGNPQVSGVYPVRAAFPAAISSQTLTDAGNALGAGVALAGLDGSGVSIALLDTGVDLSQPYLGGRVERGIDIVGGTGTAAARRDPQNRHLIERHGTELAGLLVGAGGPGGSHGVAPGASVLPIRVAGWQAGGHGKDVVYARSDQLIAGLDRAVDPNGDGDTHDAVRIALIGVAEPFAAFSDSPEAQAVAGALALDVLVVAPAGNSGVAGPLYGSIAGPAASPAALSVGAIDSRPDASTVRVVLHRGLDIVADGPLPLLDTSPSSPTGDLPLALPRLESSLAGKVALVAGGADPAAAVASAVGAGAAAVLLYGSQPPAGALGDPGVPVVGVPPKTAHELLSLLVDGVSVAAALGRPAAGPNPQAGHVVSFSSRGLTFDGLLAPVLTAPGVGIATSEPGATADGEPAFASVTGTSVSAAVVAGAAALLVDERPGLTARDLASLLTGSSRPSGLDPTAAGAGVVDVGASAVGEVAASQTSLGFGPWTGAHWHATRPLTLHNVSSRQLTLSIASSSGLLTISPSSVVLGPGATRKVTVTARSSSRPAAPAVTGILTVRPQGGEALRVPWTLAASPTVSLLRRVSLTPTAFHPSDTKPAVLRVVAGAVTGGPTVEIEPVARLDVLLYGSNGAFLGVLTRARDLLPGTYSFGITGRRPDGTVLHPGSYEIRLVAWPVRHGRLSRAKIAFRIQ